MVGDEAVSGGLRAGGTARTDEPRSESRPERPWVPKLIGAVSLVIGLLNIVAALTPKLALRFHLLSEVLPGYSVDLPGSIVGAAELFVVLYLVCQVFALVYNRVADARRQRA